MTATEDHFSDWRGPAGEIEPLPSVLASTLNAIRPMSAVTLLPRRPGGRDSLTTADRHGVAHRIALIDDALVQKTNEPRRKSAARRVWRPDRIDAEGLQMPVR